MPRRGNAVRVHLQTIGDGQVLLDRNPDDILEPASQVRYDGPPSPDTTNLRLRDGLARPRPGYQAFGNTPASNPITGLFYATFDDGTTQLVRTDKNTIAYSTGGNYTDITPAPAPAGTNTDFWTFAMVDRTGSVNPKNQLFMTNGVDGIWKWVGTGSVSLVSGAPTAAKVIVPFLNRAFVMNHEDSGGDRKHSRVTYSIPGDPETWTGTGSGTVDLSQDAYPITAAAVRAGGLNIFKGDANGGAFYRGVATGVPSQPVRYDSVSPSNRSGVGILLPRTLIQLPIGAYFFVGHDAMYLYDGLTAFQPIAPGITRTLLKRINQDALDAAHAWYKPRTNEIHLAIPTSSSTTPDEVWVIDVRDQRAWGPYEYTDVIMAASQFQASGAVTWAELVGIWTAQTEAWQDLGGPVGASVHVYGDSVGASYEDIDLEGSDDDGTTFTSSYTTPIITPEARLVPVGDGSYVELDRDDLLTLHDVSIVYKDAAASWTPTVELSVDGGATWTTISNGSTIGGGTNRLIQQRYRTGGVYTANTFQVRVSGTGMYLHTVVLEFTYAGYRLAVEA